MIILVVTGILGDNPSYNRRLSAKFAGDLELLRSSSQESDKEAGNSLEIWCQGIHIPREDSGKFWSQQTKKSLNARYIYIIYIYI